MLLYPSLALVKDRFSSKVLRRFRVNQSVAAGQSKTQMLPHHSLFAKYASLGHLGRMFRKIRHCFRESISSVSLTCPARKTDEKRGLFLRLICFLSLFVGRTDKIVKTSSNVKRQQGPFCYTHAKKNVFRKTNELCLVHPVCKLII